MGKVQLMSYNIQKAKIKVRLGFSFIENAEIRYC